MKAALMHLLFPKPDVEKGIELIFTFVASVFEKLPIEIHLFIIRKLVK